MRGAQGGLNAAAGHVQGRGRLVKVTVGGRLDGRAQAAGGVGGVGVGWVVEFSVMRRLHRHRVTLTRARADHPRLRRAPSKKQRAHPAPHPARRASLHSTPQTQSGEAIRPPGFHTFSPRSPLRARDTMRHDRAPVLQRRQLPGLEVSARGRYVTNSPGSTRLLPKPRPHLLNALSGCHYACLRPQSIATALACSHAAARRAS